MILSQLRSLVPALLISWVCSHHGSAFGQLTVTVEKAGVQKSQVAGVSTMDFNASRYQPGSYTRLESEIGVYSGEGRGFAILAPTGGNADYGGASATGLPSSTQTQYVAIGAQSGQTSMTLQLASAMNYFGMYWAAGDGLNRLAFYLGNQLISRYSTQNVVDFLQGRRAYYGNPNTGRNSSEPYAYLNFFGGGGASFDRIVFSNASTATGFESDNHSVAFLDPPIPTGTVVPNSVVAPEPSTFLTGIIAAAGGAAYWRLNRQKSKKRWRKDAAHGFSSTAPRS